MENKYINQALKGETQAWKYIIGIVVVFIGTLLFNVPYKLALDNKIASGNVVISKVQDLSYVMTLFDSNTTLFYLMLPFLGALLFLFFVVTKFHKLPWTAFTTSRNKIDYKRVLFSFSIWGGISLVVILLDVFLNPDEIVLNFKASKFIILFTMAVFMIPIQTSSEEYLFRGYLMQGLGVVSKTNWLPLLVTSVTFGLMHLSNPEVTKLGYGIMLFYVGTGFFLGVITLMDEGIELSLGFHAANNLITALLITTDWTAFQTHSVFKDFSTPNLVLELCFMCVLYPLLLLLFARKYKWNHWKEKLL